MKKMSFVTESDLLEGFAEAIANVASKCIRSGQEMSTEFLDANPIEFSPEFKEKIFTEITVDHVKNGPVEVGSAKDYINNLINKL